MSTADLFVLGLAAALLLGIAVAILLSRRRERAQPVRARLGGPALHPGLSAALSEIVAGHHDKAIDHLREVVREDTDAVEVYVLLGDLYRECGQVERALRIHRSVLNRSGLTNDQKVASLVALARDHETAGFLDRARQSFEEVARLAPEGKRPLRHLRRLAERSGDWEAALEAQQRLLKLGGGDEDRKVLAFLHERVGSEALARADAKAARKHFEKAIATWPRCTPAYLHLDAGRTKEAAAAWKALLEADPARAWLAFPRFEKLRLAGREVAGFEDWLRALVEARPRDWRARIALTEQLAKTGRVEEARAELDAALRAGPGAPAVQRAAWSLAAEHGVTAEQARHVAELLGGRQAADGHSCLHCRYRTDAPEWRCPHCHRWDAFVPED